MSQGGEQPAPRRTALDFACGRTSTRAELRARLAFAPSCYLWGALENPELTEDEMALLLRNRTATADLLQRIASDGRWTRSYEIKRRLVFHRHTPPVESRALLHHLHWRELTELSIAAQVDPALRRRAEEMLAVRLPGLAVGERVALVRRASRGVVVGLLQSDESLVLRSLLDNARVREADVLRIASRARVEADVLSHLASHPRFGPQRAVRLALVGNERTPLADALRLLHGLARQDLRRIVRDVNVRTVLRVGAERRLRGGIVSENGGQSRTSDPRRCGRP